MAEKKTRTVGYAVTLKNSAPMALYEDDEHPRGGILLFGRAATVFPTRKRAQGAIERTVRWAYAAELDWGGPERYRIIPMEAPHAP